MDEDLTSTIPLAEHLRGLSLTGGEEVREALRAPVAGWRAARVKALQARFERDGDAGALVRALAEMTDEIIGAVFALLSPARLGVAAVATGGYGRREMFPFSDVDLLFLYRPAARGQAERMARTLLYVLWDLGLKVGHALRSVEDTLQLADEDLTIRTNLLDARLIVGDAELCAQLLRRFEATIAAAGAERFVEQRLAERDERHRRFNDSRYLLEPNVKESKGGLRDAHTLLWIARVAYGTQDLQALGVTPGEYRAFERARRFLWSLRAHLHFSAGKAEERLTFDRQQAIAPRMGYRDRPGQLAVERLMRRYFMAAREVGNFTRTVCALLEEQHKRKLKQPLSLRMASAWKLDGFTLDGERLRAKSAEEFTREPLRLLKLFAVAQKYGYGIHPKTLQWVARAARGAAALRDDARAQALFLDILLSARGAEQALRRMSEAGLLGRFLPEFGRVIGQMQFNMYHIYTVDEHIIVALGILNALEQGRLRDDMPLASEVIRRVQMRRALFVALLCHDLGKGQGGDQCELGAAVAEKVARRMKLPEQETQTVAWLVRHHLLFTDTAFKRDANDPRTVRDFVDAVKSVERLRLLLCLTVADMRAVGPGVWNAWKAALLRALFLKAETLMRTGKEAGGDASGEARQALAALLSQGGTEDAEAYLALSPPDYATALEPAAHAGVMALLKRQAAEQAPLAMQARHDEARAVTELTLVTPDQHALFSKLAGAISLAGANIIAAKIFTLKNGMAVDVFHVQDQEGRAFSQKERLARMSLRLRQAVTGEIDVGRELARRKTPYAQRSEAFDVPGQVFIENDASATHTVVEVVGRDRIGFLYRVTQALSEAGLTIGSAHISTYGAQAVDVFYVKDAFGMKILHEGKQRQLRAALLEAVEGGA